MYNIREFYHMLIECLILSDILHIVIVRPIFAYR